MIIAIAVVVLLPLTIVGGRLLQARADADAPVAVVREFLEASRSGDVETALSLAIEEPTWSTAFMVPEAVNGDWEIDAVELRGIEPGREAAVQARIIGPEDTSVSAVLHLEFSSGGEWLLEDPFSYGEFMNDVPFPYFEVNGHRVDVEKFGGPSGLSLLPGVYEFYAEANDLLDQSAGAYVLFGGDAIAVGGGQSPASDADPWGMSGFTPVEGADELLQSRTEAYIDECLAEIEFVWMEGCPFRMAPNDAADHFDIEADDAKVDWELVEYPQMTLAPVESSYVPGVIQTLTSRDPGLLEVVFSYGDGDPVVTYECPFVVEHLYIEMHASGEFVIGPREDPTPPPEDHPSWMRGGPIVNCRLL